MSKAAEESIWRLENKSGLWGKDEQTLITLRVDHDRVFGTSGCGDYSADFTHDGDNWSIPEVTRQPVPCPSRAAKPADRLLELLTKVTRVELDHTQLRLITPTETLFFSRR